MTHQQDKMSFYAELSAFATILTKIFKLILSSLNKCTFFAGMF